MQGYTIEHETINGVDLEVRIDEEGVKWYPLSRFIKRVLLKDEKAKDFIKSEKISQNIMYVPLDTTNPIVTHLWYINEPTLKYILKNIDVSQYTKRTIAKEEALHGALKYFGIKREDRGKMYTFITPTKEEYSEWELLCFQCDEDVKSEVIWKMCINCGRYFPNTKNYFRSLTYKKLENTCLICEGNELKSANPDLQTLKDCDRMDLVKCIVKDDPIGFYEKVKNNPVNHELEYFKRGTRLVEVLKYIEKKRRITGAGGFYMANLSKTFGMSTIKMKYVIGDSFEIGVRHPLPQHAYRYIPDDLTEEEKEQRKIIEDEAKRRKKESKRKNAENTKAASRKKTKERRENALNELLKWCKENYPNSISKSYFSFNVFYAFIREDKMHIIAFDRPKKYIPSRVYVIPSVGSNFDALKREVQGKE